MTSHATLLHCYISSMKRFRIAGAFVGLFILLAGCASTAPGDPGVAATPTDTSTADPENGSATPGQSNNGAAGAASSAIDTEEQILPVDPLVTVGTLPNGLTYYIRENDEPRDRAFLRFAVNAGSILEDEDQLGLAHFVEHMAFNGTENYSGNEIIAFLERIGMQFGPDINAYTSFDETVYQLTVPTDDSDTFRQAFSVLLEWADRMALTDEEIEKERGVIIEEWRSSRSASQRIAEQQYPVLFAGSRYANRLPIGDIDLIASFHPDAARRFYADWYRPDLSVEGPHQPREREHFAVPEHSDTKFVVAADPETRFTDISVVTKRTAEELSTEEDYRGLIVGSLFTSMLNSRLDEITRRSDAPFIGAGVSSGRFVRTTAAASLSAAVEGNEVTAALEALLIEARRLTEHGFTSTELDRAKLDRLRAIEQAYRERDNTNSARLADEYVRTFLEGEASPGITFERDLHEKLMPGITLDELNELAADYLSQENRVVLVSAIESEDLPLVTVTELQETFRVAQGAPVDPYEDRIVSSELLGTLPRAGRIVNEIDLDAEDVVLWELSNGARVVFKSTDLRADQVIFSAFSSGGTSLVPDDDYRSAQYASIFVEQMGYGEFAPPDLERVLAGKALSVSPYIGSVEEGLSGAASAEDLELLFQLIHLKMTSPRTDADAFTALKRQFQAIIANQEAQPQYQFSKLISERFNLGHLRAMPIDATGVDSIELESVLEVYQDRFGDASDFTFLFVGNLEGGPFRELVEQYLASLPATVRDDSWLDVGIERPEGIVVDSVNSGVDPVSQVVVFLHDTYEFSQQNNLAIRTVERALDIRMQEVIREDESGTYGVGVQAQFTRIPRERYTVSITFRADPDRVDELTERLMEVVEELRTVELEESYVERVQETLRSGFEEGLTSNQFWIGQIEYALKNGRPMSAIRRYLDLVDAVDSRSIVEAAKRYLTDDAYVQITLYPAEEE